MDCIFCQIIQKKQSADVVSKNKEIIAFKDIHPQAPVHILVVPKKHIGSVQELKSQDKNLVGELILVAKEIAKEQGIFESGFKLIFNCGSGAGQIVNHLHLHLLGGWENN